jgi:hypothetical protein
MFPTDSIPAWWHACRTSARPDLPQTERHSRPPDRNERIRRSLQSLEQFPRLGTALEGDGGQEKTVPGGGTALVDAGYPQSVHLAFPGVDYQLEVTTRRRSEHSRMHSRETCSRPADAG